MRIWKSPQFAGRNMNNHHGLLTAPAIPGRASFEHRSVEQVWTGSEEEVDETLITEELDEALSLLMLCRLLVVSESLISVTLTNFSTKLSKYLSL